MTFQYALRFDSGKRSGETVSISGVAASGGVFTIGRSPGNSLQVVDPSISGRHAELEVTDDGVELRDLKSTNGTLVDGRKVRAVELQAGDEFQLGAIQFSLLEAAVPEPGPMGGPMGGPTQRAPGGGADEGDLVLEDAPLAVPARPKPSAPAAAPPAAAPEAPVADDVGQTRITPREDSLEITAEDLARSKKSSKLGPILLVGLAAVGGAAWWFLRPGDDEGGGRPARSAGTPVEPPSGNLLAAGYSFEKPEGWASAGDETAAQFDVVSSAARSGRRGLAADLAAGEVAVLESDPISFPGRSSGGDRTVQALGFVAGDAAIDARLGLRFVGRDGSTRTTVWSSAARIAAASETDGFVEVSVVASAPPGMDRVQVLVRAASPGTAPGNAGGGSEGDDAVDIVTHFVHVDDVALVPADSASHAPMAIAPWALTPLGGAATAPAEMIAITSLDVTHVSSLQVLADAPAESNSVASASPLTMALEGVRVSVTPQQAGTLTLRAEPALAEGGLATIASVGGYASHGASFERDGVTSLLLGGDNSLIWLAFPAPVSVAARPHGDAVTLRAAVPAGQPFTIQLGFIEERTLAERIARRAGDERKSGDSGASLRSWGELLNEVPVDRRLVERAAAERSEILAAGRAELKELAGEVERARFFGLADLFREKLARAQELSTRFRGSDVEADSVALTQVIEDELATLDVDTVRDERVRLEGISAAMKNLGASKLAEQVDAYRTTMGQRPGRADPGTNATTEGGR